MERETLMNYRVGEVPTKVIGDVVLIAMRFGMEMFA